MVSIHKLVPLAGKVKSRLYKSEDDLLQMRAMLIEGRAQSTEWHYFHVGELMWNHFMVTCHLDPHEHIRLWHDHKGRLAAYAMLGEDPSFDCQVLPDYEWSGIEAEALEWAESRVRALRAKDPQHWSGHMVSGARQDDLRRIEFLEQHGFHYKGEFAEVNMLRSLDEPIPETSYPPGCTMRSMTDNDLNNRAGAERDVWLPWTVGNVSDEDYARLMKMPGYEPELDILSFAADGVIAAYVNCWVDPVNRIGDFGPVGARAPYRRQGYTRAVLLEGLRRLRAHGMQRVCVSTGVTNTPARNLYESIGFKIVNQYLDYVKEE
jgi:GNAT superfamily N-acetyltransferase